VGADAQIRTGACVLEDCRPCSKVALERRWKTMRADEVVVGQVYLARVSGRVVPVRIERPVLVGIRKVRTGWEATNLATGRRILIRSAQRLRKRVEVKL
jgi:hypothetical protein